MTKGRTSGTVTVTENNSNELVKCIELVKKYDGKDPNPQENQPNDRPVDLPIS